MNSRNYSFWFTVATLAVLICGVAIGLLLNTVALAPRAIVKMNPIDLKELRSHDKRLVTFSIKNDGNTILLVEPFGTPCCGSFRSTQILGIRPNSEATVTVGFVLRDIPERKQIFLLLHFQYLTSLTSNRNYVACRIALPYKVQTAKTDR